MLQYIQVSLSLYIYLPLCLSLSLPLSLYICIYAGAGGRAAGGRAMVGGQVGRQLTLAGGRLYGFRDLLQYLGLGNVSSRLASDSPFPAPIPPLLTPLVPSPPPSRPQTGFLTI